MPDSSLCSIAGLCAVSFIGIPIMELKAWNEANAVVRLSRHLKDPSAKVSFSIEPAMCRSMEPVRTAIRLKDFVMCFVACIRAFDRGRFRIRLGVSLFFLLPNARGFGEVLFVSNYVANSGNVSSFQYDGSSLASRQVITSNVNGPTGLAFDGSGNLFVANVGVSTAPFTSKVAKYVPDQNGDFSYFSQFASTANMIGPRGLAIGASGRFYAANTGQNTMSIFDALGSFISNVTSVSTNPRGLAFDAAGLLYVVNFNNQIRIFDVSGTTSPSQVGLITNTGGIALSGPQGIVFDAAGRMLVSNYTDDSVSILVKSGSTWTDAGKLSGNMSGPYGMDFDASANLFVANFDNSSISKFAPSGASYTFVTSYTTGITSPTFIAFQPVPEPSSIGLMTMSIAALAWRRSWSVRYKGPMPRVSLRGGDV